MDLSRLRSARKGGRRGIASVIGTMIFVVVLMLAIGAQSYIQGLQAQSNQSSQQAQEAANLHSGELLVFSNPAAGLTLVNSGLESASVVGMYFRFPNGSIYASSSFNPVYLPASAGAPVQGIVPGGVCKDQGGSGTANCLARFNAITGTTTAGYSVGVVTSRGNVFWYTPAISLVRWSQLTNFPPGCSTNQYTTAVGPTLTCSQVGWAQLTGYPSPCGSSQYVSAYGATLTCSLISLPWSQLTNFPSACPSGQFISQLGTSITCGNPGSVITSTLTSTLNVFPSMTTVFSVPLQANTEYNFIVTWVGVETGGGGPSLAWKIPSLAPTTTLTNFCYAQPEVSFQAACVSSTGTILTYGGGTYGSGEVVGVLSTGASSDTLTLQACGYFTSCGGWSGSFKLYAGTQLQVFVVNH
ncbi:MAG: hypothetical protein JRN06_00230 [Nitrososphaerota archaeon]|nr:hypothetical protein [Nitrososphaerota archaeon]MDG7023721.1 hypothetical protein [Nitrososphaerota archaeon]